MPLYTPDPTTAPAAFSDITAFGHSYLTGGGVTYVDKQYITLLGGMLRSRIQDLGMGGSQAAHDYSWLGVNNGQGGWSHVLQNYQPSTTGAPYTPANTMPYIHYGHNDMAHHATDATGAPRTIFKTAIRTILSRLSTAKIYEDTHASVAYGVLTWQPALASTLRNSGTQYRPIPGNTATITITLPADFEGGTVAIGFTVYPTSDGTITWSGTSGVSGTTNFSGLAYANNGSGTRRNSSNGHVVRFTSLTSANAGQTIIGTISSVSASAFSTPAAPGAITNVGTTGATTYSYRRGYRTYNGDTIWSAVSSTTTGNATLSTTNYNVIPIGPAWPSGAEAELIFRTTGGSTQGLIKTLSAPAAVNDQNLAATTYTVNSANPLLNGFAFDYWQIEASNPTTKGVVIGLNKLQNAGYINSVTDTDVDNYNSDLQSVIAEFASNQWLFVDVDSALNKTAAYFGVTDLVHPNNRGHAIVAQTIYRAITNWTQGISVDNIAAQSRMVKNITSRVLNKRYWTYNGATTGQDYTLTTTAAAIDSTNLNAVLNAEAGDDIVVEVQGSFGNEAATGLLDVCTCDVSGNPRAFFTTLNSTFGSGWPSMSVTAATTTLTPINARAVYTVQPEDLVTINTVPGCVFLKLWGKSSGTKTLYGGGTANSNLLVMHVYNVGSRNFGFNTS